ncbi:MAG: efflux RND transporter periplasmic adaptor subunit [Bacillus sp. (in: firmicutes)]
MGWKKYTLCIVILLFIACNIGVLIKSKHSFDRSIYAHKWTKVAERDLLQKMNKKGISTALEKQTVYLDDNKGNFSGFLVQKGEMVQANTPLLAYTNYNAKQMTDGLQLEINQLIKEKSSLQTQINELSRLQTNLSLSTNTGEINTNFNTNTNTNINTDTNTNTNTNTGTNTDQVMKTSIQQQILDKEQEMAKIDAVMEKNQLLIQQNEEALGNSTEKSTISGYVASIKEDLANPIITIVSEEQKVEGIVTESERTKIKKGMEVIVKDKNKKVYSGTVDFVSALPKDKASIKKDSLYPFTLTLNEQPKEFVSGTHVDVQVITEKVLNAITIPKKSILNKKGTNKIYIIENGNIQENEVTTGLAVDGYQQISEGAKKGEIAIIPSINKKMNSHFFITPIKVKEFPNITLENRRKKELLRYFIKGFL